MQFKTSLNGHFTFDENEMRELLELISLPDLAVETKVANSTFLKDLQHELHMLLQSR